MATFSTTLYTGQSGTAGASLNAPAAFPLAKVAFGKLRIVEIPYVLAGTEATGDFLNLTILKQGDRVLPGLSFLFCEDPGTTMTAIVGDLSDDNRYADTMTLSAGGVFPFYSTPGVNLYVPADVNVPIPPVAATDQTVVKLKFASVNTPTAGAKFMIYLAVVAE
jgi:hypothetical protein